MATFNDEEYFLLRFAQPPIGELRFKQPVEFIGGEAVFDVSGVSGVMCTQWSPQYSSLIGQEDCLLLNVYVPGLALLLQLAGPRQ